MSLATRRFVAALGLIGAAGCIAQQPSPSAAPVPTAASEWPTAYARALGEARESRLAIADRVLVDFAQRFPGSPESDEVSYWRAVYKLDPDNAQSTREALVLLDSYLAKTPSGLHRTEATAMRRLASALEQRAAALAAATAVPAAPKPEDKMHEEELTRLRDELARANAELTRIRRRLARP